MSDRHQQAETCERCGTRDWTVRAVGRDVPDRVCADCYTKHYEPEPERPELPVEPNRREERIQVMRKVLDGSLDDDGRAVRIEVLLTPALVELQRANERIAELIDGQHLEGLAHRGDLAEAELERVRRELREACEIRDGEVVAVDPDAIKALM